ncbi:MAG: hypothetical protein Q8M31_15000 [Beijerinckiaceae bacterium]|nr:hypothetical protein [Beijerinckiaceae bacterium]
MTEVDRKIADSNPQFGRHPSENKPQPLKPAAKKKGPTSLRASEDKGSGLKAVPKRPKADILGSTVSQQPHIQSSVKVSDDIEGLPSLPEKETNEAVSQLADSYCDAIKPSISEKLMAWQRARLDKIKLEVEEKLVLLSKRRNELDELERRQQETSSRLTGNMVSILVRMRPDAAASQSAAMDESAAAALIIKMDARSAGPILSEIPSSKAARLAEYITGRNHVGNH